MSLEEGAALSRNDLNQMGSSHQELRERHGSTLVAHTSLSGRNLPCSTRQAANADPSEHLGPEMSIAVTNIPSSLSQTSGQPIQEGNQLRPTDNLSKTRQSTPTQVIMMSGTSSDQRVSLILQEVNELRAQMAEVVRRQQLEASRESHRSYHAPSEGEDGQTAPPSYSDGGF